MSPLRSIASPPQILLQRADAIKHACYILDQNGQIAYVNPPARRLHPRAIGKRLETIYPTCDDGTFLQHLLETFQGNARLIDVACLRDEQRWRFHLEPYQTARNHDIHWIIATRTS